MRSMGRRLLDLQVRLAVQIARLDVAQPLRLGRGDDHDVRGNELVGFHAHNVAHTDILPFLRSERRVGGEHLGEACVELGIGAVPFPVLGRLFESGDEQHADERYDGGILIGRRDAGDLLNGGSEEEEQVGVFAELL